GAVLAAVARYPASVFASQVSSQRERHFGKASIARIVVVPDFDAVVCVDSRSVNAQSIFAVPIIVENERQPLLWPVQDLSTEPVTPVKPGIGLPPVDNPRFNFQLVRGKPLDPDSVEEPRRVG